MKNNILDKLLFVTEGDHQTTLAQLYHENSKVGRQKYNLDSTISSNSIMEDLHRIINGKGKDYSFHKSIDINNENDISKQRRSIRNFSEIPINNKTFNSILSSILSNPINNNYKRAYPSAGGLYPLEFYPIVVNVENVESGLYYIDAYKHKLMQLRTNLDMCNIQSMFMDEEAIHKTGFIILITAVLPRLQIKYGDRAYRYAHLEAGHAAQVILEQCKKHNAQAFPVGGFIEREIESLLDIDGHEEIALYSILIGQSNDY